jgi:hypothetical protein
MLTHYNEYGKPIEFISDNIEPGDLVEFRDAKSSYVNGRRIRIFISLEGYWDGKKVQFNDQEKTIVRTKNWLKLKAKHLKNVIGVCSERK